MLVPLLKTLFTSHDFSAAGSDGCGGAVPAIEAFAAGEIAAAGLVIARGAVIAARAAVEAELLAAGAGVAAARGDELALLTTATVPFPSVVAFLCSPVPSLVVCTFGWEGFGAGRGGATDKPVRLADLNA